MILTKLAIFLGLQKRTTGRTFFDYSSEEKKKILKRAVEEGGKMQKDLIKEYDRKFNLNRATL